MLTVLLLSVEFTASFLSLLLNALLYFALQRYSVFHENLRVICRHLTLCVLVESILVETRSLVIGLDFGDPEWTARCLSSTSTVPFHISVLFTVFIMLAMVERFYANHKYATYEEEDAEPRLARLCRIAWTPMAVEVAVSSMKWFNGGWNTWCSEPTALPEDTAQQAWQLALRRNLAHIIVFLFLFAFSIVFCELHKQNAERREVFVKHHYHLRGRFQIGENIKTGHLLAPVSGGAALLAIILFLHDLRAYSSDAVNHDMELSYLLPPIFGIAFALNFLFRDPVLRRKTMPLTRELLCRPGASRCGVEEHKLLEST